MIINGITIVIINNNGYHFSKDRTSEKWPFEVQV